MSNQSEQSAKNAHSFDEQLDAILKPLIGHDDGIEFGNGYHDECQEELTEAKQALTSLMKELVAESKPYRETIIDKWNKDRADEVRATNAAMNAWADIYEQNLLKALEEV